MGGGGEGGGGGEKEREGGGAREGEIEMLVYVRSVSGWVHGMLLASY